MNKNLMKGFNFVKKKITTVTQTAVNKTVNLIEENQSGEYIKDLYIALKNKPSKDSFLSPPISYLCQLRALLLPSPQYSL